MKDISNKSLMALLIIAIFISVVGTWVVVKRAPGISQIAGGVTATGTAQLTVGTSTSIIFANNAVNFGAVGVNTTGGYNNCTLTTNDSLSEGTGCNGGYTAQTGLVIENNGNTDINVTLNCSDTPATFLGGTLVTPVYQYRVTDNETISCNTPTPADWTTVPNADTVACTTLSFNNDNDTIRLDVKMVVPIDSSTGVRTSTWTATGTAI